MKSYSAAPSCGPLHPGAWVVHRHDAPGEGLRPQRVHQPRVHTLGHLDPGPHTVLYHRDASKQEKEDGLDSKHVNVIQKCNLLGLLHELRLQDSDHRCLRIQG